jgi:hypothetical protein
MGKATDLLVGSPAASTNVLTGDPVLTTKMNENAARIEDKPIFDVIKSARDLLKHAVVDMPLQTWEKTKNLLANTLAAPFIATAQIGTNIKNSVQAVLGAGMMAVEGLVSTPMSHIGGQAKKLKLNAAPA